MVSVRPGAVRRLNALGVASDERHQNRALRAAGGLGDRHGERLPCAHRYRARDAYRQAIGGGWCSPARADPSRQLIAGGEGRRLSGPFHEPVQVPAALGVFDLAVRGDGHREKCRLVHQARWTGHQQPTDSDCAQVLEGLLSGRGDPAGQLELRDHLVVEAVEVPFTGEPGALIAVRCHHRTRRREAVEGQRRGALRESGLQIARCGPTPERDGQRRLVERHVPELADSDR